MGTGAEGALDLPQVVRGTLELILVNSLRRVTSAGT